MAFIHNSERLANFLYGCQYFVLRESVSVEIDSKTGRVKVAGGFNDSVRFSAEFLAGYAEVVKQELLDWDKILKK